jgi:predicted CXXCH cytochrome family protein
MERERGSRKLRIRLFRLLLLLGIVSLAGSAPGLAAQAQEAPANASPAGAQSVAAASPAAAPSPPAAAASPAKYVGSKVCKSCHSKQAKEFSQTIMGKDLLLHARDEEERLGCEGCHGPGSLYIKEMAAAMGKGRTPNDVGEGPAGTGLITFRKDSGESAKTDNQVCLTCHENGERAFWQASTHAFRGLRCVDCHTVMRAVTATQQPAPQIQESPLRTEFVTPFVVTRPETQVCTRCHLREAMEINLPSHMPVREGSMTCTDCHNPHGGPYPGQLRAATVNEVCYRCHAEKRGPFLWLHAPVMMNCLDCHTPHGSVNQHMLTIREPLLCQRCHVSTRHPSEPQKRSTVFVFGQSCTNCHSQIHGSNSPGGRVFTR